MVKNDQSDQLYTFVGNRLGAEMASNASLRARQLQSTPGDTDFPIVPTTKTSRYLKMCSLFLAIIPGFNGNFLISYKKTSYGLLSN